MSDLVVWLTTILDEDEQMADLGHGLGGKSLTYFEADEFFGIEVNSNWLRADIAAKRAIIEAASNAITTAPERGYDFDSEQERAQATVWEQVLRLLASGYAARPGYDETWRP